MARTTGAATDLITFSRASSGTALTKVAYGPELVTNGGFDTDVSSWNESVSTVTWSSGEALVTATAAYGGIRQAITSIPSGEYALLEADIRLGTATQARLVAESALGGSFVVTVTTDGRASLIAPSDGDFNVRVDVGGSTVGSTIYVDNISVRKVFYNSPTGTLKLISHPTNKPRVEYDANGVAKGLLIEEARTNLVANSLVFTSAPGAQGITVTSSSETAPDGTTSASLCTATGTAIHRVRNSVTVTASGVTYSASVFVKNVDADYIQINNAGDLQYYANFDLVNGVVGTTGSKTTSTITAYPNGWYRITASYDGTGVMNAVANIMIVTSASAPYSDGANKPGTQVHMWGLQREQGLFPTSYIPTSGATATRSADLASVSVSEFGYNQAQGSVVVNFEASRALDSNAVLVNPSDGTTSNRMTLWGGTTSGTTLFVVDSGVAQATLVGGIPAAGTHKTAIAYATNDFALTLDAGAIQSDTLGTVPTVSQIDIGRYASDLPLNGHIKSLNYYPLRLSDAKLQELTS